MTSELVIEQFQPSDQGTYTCVARTVYNNTVETSSKIGEALCLFSDDKNHPNPSQNWFSRVSPDIDANCYVFYVQIVKSPWLNRPLDRCTNVNTTNMHKRQQPWFKVSKLLHNLWRFSQLHVSIRRRPLYGKIFTLTMKKEGIYTSSVCPMYVTFL